MSHDDEFWTPAGSDKVVSVVVTTVVFAVGTVLALTLLRQVDEPITLIIRCTSGDPVVGAWVEVANRGSAFTTSDPTRPGVRRYVLAFGGPYSVNVGCGGSPGDWEVPWWRASAIKPSAA